MPTEQILALLIAERDKLNRAIEALQGPTKRRGRPPANSWTFTTPLGSQVVSENPQPQAKKKRRKFTAAQRKQQAERMKAFWAAKKKAAVKPQTRTAGKPKKSARAA
jgi:hypothetical protein